MRVRSTGCSAREAKIIATAAERKNTPIQRTVKAVRKLPRIKKTPAMTANKLRLDEYEILWMMNRSSMHFCQSDYKEHDAHAL